MGIEQYYPSCINQRQQKVFFSTFIYFVINGGTDQIIYKSFCQTNESIDIEILKYYISFSYIDDSPYKPAAAFI